MGAGNFSISPVITYSNSDATLTSDYWAEYQYVWGDEFNDGRINGILWNYGTLARSEDDVKKNIYHDRNLVQVNNSGKAVFTVEYDSTEGKYYTPPDLHTKSTMNYKYGYIEMRAKLPLVKNAWSTFWMQSVVDNTGTVVPASEENKNNYKAEIDVYETLGADDTLLISNLHKWYMPEVYNQTGLNGTNGVKHEQLKSSYKGTISISRDEYHIIGMEWTEEYMKMFVDGVPFVTYTFSELDSKYNIFVDNRAFDGGDNKYYTTMNGFLEPLLVSIGTTVKNASSPDLSTLPHEYYIDWVRLYQKNPVANTTIWTK